VRMALEPGMGRTAVPVRSALLGLTLAVATVAGAVTFGTNLDRLVSTPSAYGWNWNLIVDTQFGAIAAGDVRAKLDRTPGLAGYAGGNYGSLVVDGHPVAAVGIDRLRGAVYPTIVRGRAPNGTDEIVLGERTLAVLHRAIGDAVRVQTDSGARTMRVVGTAVFPGLGQGGFTPTDLGDGAAVAATLLQPSYLPEGHSYTFVLIVFAPAADPARLAARLAPDLRRAWCPPDQLC